MGCGRGSRVEGVGSDDGVGIADLPSLAHYEYCREEKPFGD